MDKQTMMKQSRINKDTLTVAITGSIGSGKSLAAGWFEKKGYEVIYADRISHQLLNKSEIKQKLIAEFGNDILRNNRIDRSKLGRLVFIDSDKLKKLNDVIHPPIIAHIKTKIEQVKTAQDNGNEKTLIFFEIPLLFETGIESCFDVTVNISADYEDRVRRIMLRNELSREEVERRMKSQLSDAVKAEKASITIINKCRVECFYNSLNLLLQFLIFLSEGKF